MASPLRVQLYHGSWQRNEDGHWSFQRKSSDLGYIILIKPIETFEDLEKLVHDCYNMNPEKPLVMFYQLPAFMLEPEGTHRPPITIMTTAEVEAMMRVKAWFYELKPCVTSGPEDVANHQFLNITTFSIGGATFVFKGYGDAELVASKEVLEEIFNEQELVRNNEAAAAGSGSSPTNAIG
ncbi:hypothetical protein Bca101_027313 [Brassica carinata]